LKQIGGRIRRYAKLRAMRANLGLLGACALLAATLAAGCGTQAADVPVPSPAQAAKRLAGSPPALAALHRQAGALLDGGQAAYDARLAALRGHPVVVNAWASWCHPCRAEIALFQRSSVGFGRRVAFLGLDVQDTAEKAHGFLHEHWLSYPSYADASSQIAHRAGVRAGLPTTIFYGRDGKVAYVHQGQYQTESQLTADIARYALAS
jgi:thiol-disulfide isomerase/thioredoxin